MFPKSRLFPLAMTFVAVLVIYHLVRVKCDLLVYTDVTFLQMVIDTLFICFCEDCEKNDGVAKPYFMSRNLMVKKTWKQHYVLFCTLLNTLSGLATAVIGITKKWMVTKTSVELSKLLVDTLCFRAQKFNINNFQIKKKRRLNECDMCR